VKINQGNQTYRSCSHNQWKTRLRIKN